VTEHCQHAIFSVIGRFRLFSSGLRANQLRFQFRLSLEQPILLMKFNEKRNLGPKNLWNDRCQDVVNRAKGIATGQMSIGVVDRADEDDWSELAAGSLADQSRGFEAVHLRHADVQHNQRKFILENETQCFRSGVRQEQVLTQTS
jgi:hypothetical protein